MMLRSYFLISGKKFLFIYPSSNTNSSGQGLKTKCDIHCSVYHNITLAMHKIKDSIPLPGVVQQQESVFLVQVLFLNVLIQLKPSTVFLFYRMKGKAVTYLSSKMAKKVKHFPLSILSAFLLLQRQQRKINTLLQLTSIHQNGFRDVNSFMVIAAIWMKTLRRHLTFLKQLSYSHC